MLVPLLSARFLAGTLSGVAAAILAVIGLVTVGRQGEPDPFVLPLKPSSVRFAAIGDGGTGTKPQYDVADQMALQHKTFPFEFVVMLGDNIYGNDTAEDLRDKFEKPYEALLGSGVRFFASLGNHDGPDQLAYAPFNMDGRRYYTFTRGNVAFFALDSTNLDPDQAAWLEGELATSKADWKICYFHHPLYSSGTKHGPELDLRDVLEPILVKGGVHVVFTGHEHFYERLRPQRGVHYFISGAAGRLRGGDLQESRYTALGFDDDQSFMLVEIAGDELYFQTVTRLGATVDSGIIRRPSVHPREQTMRLPAAEPANAAPSPAPAVLFPAA